MLTSALRLIMCCAALLCCVSCTATGFGGARNIISSGRPPETSLRGDWNDLDAAITSGAKAAELAILERNYSQSPGGERHFSATFLASDDRTFTLEASETSRSKDPATPSRISLTTRGVPSRDLEREERLLEGTAERLKDLAGKDWAPISE